MMLTPEGITLLFNLAAGEADDPIANWLIVASDGSTETTAQVDRPVVEQTDEGAAMTLTATFGEMDANHTWNAREVRSGKGVTVDLEQQDFGRKAQGQEWVVEATLDLSPVEGKQ